MPHQLDYRHILPRQGPNQTTTTILPVVTSIIGNDTMVVTGSPTITDLGLAATATGDPAVRRVSSLFFYTEFG